MASSETSGEMVKFYLTIRKDHPRAGKAQRTAANGVLLHADRWDLAVVTGIAIWKPVQLSPLTMLLGGYVWARYWHFLAMLALVVLTLGHVFMVFTVDPYALQSIITGGYREDLSPEARNARPFVHLLPPHKAES